MTAKQRVSGPVIVVVLVAVGVVSYFAFNRPELAPPGVGVHDHGGEEAAAAPELPWSPPVKAEELQSLAIGLMPLGVSAVFPPLVEDRGAGARIAAVGAGSPAARAGLRPGDLVTRFGEWAMTQPYSLVGALERVEPDEEYEVVVVRAGEEHTLVVAGLRPLPLEERVR